MLMYFAMRFQQASTEKENITHKQQALIEDLTDTEATRTLILDDIKALLEKDGIEVLVVKDEGILRLPEKLLFSASSWEITNKEPIKALGNALTRVLPCYTLVADLPEQPKDCRKTEAKIEAIFIEGHADFVHFRDPTSGPPEQQSPGTQNSSAARRTYVLKDNVDLSAIRATSTFRELLKAQPDLGRFLSPEKAPILSVSGYGEYRPIPRDTKESEEAYKQRLRRIDLRILMATPRSETAKQLQEQIERTDNP